MERLLIELREDIRFENGAWHPADARAQALVDALAGACAAPRRAFSRPAAALDRERVALGRDPGLPDLNLFYVVEGDAEELARLELVAAVTPIAAPAPAVATAGLPADALVVRPAAGRLLGDEIDRAAATLGTGDLLVVPLPPSDDAAWAAAELAARRGVHVVAVRQAQVPAWVRHVIVVDAPDLVPAATRASAGPRVGRGRRLRVTLDSVRLVQGGDRGDSEIYLEGFIDDAGERFPFRVPSAGAVGKVVRGAPPTPLGAVVHRSDRPVEGDLVVHIEVWEQDHGRESLVDPDDLLGIHDARFTEAERWGEGRHEAQRIAGEGECEITYTVELTRGRT